MVVLPELRGAPFEDPLPPGDTDLLDEDAPAFDGEEGCPKCGHDSATVDDIADRKSVV